MARKSFSTAVKSFSVKQRGRMSAARTSLGAGAGVQFFLELNAQKGFFHSAVHSKALSRIATLDGLASI